METNKEFNETEFESKEEKETNWETIIDNASPHNQGKYYCAINLPFIPELVYFNNGAEPELDRMVDEVISIRRNVVNKCLDKGLMCIECKDSSADIVFTSDDGDNVPFPGYSWGCLLTNPTNSKAEWQVKVGTLHGLTREAFEEAKSFLEECRAKSRAKKAKRKKKN